MISSVNKRLTLLNPELDSHRTNYSELLSAKSAIEKSIGMFEQLDFIRGKKEMLLAERSNSTVSSVDSTSLPTSALFELSDSVRKLLTKWKLPNADSVHFDKETGDFVIDGKNRSINGKGYRAITHAAATLGLMKYAEQREIHHLGYVVLDTPLLAYEEPESEADDLTGTDVNVRFFDSLAEWSSRQIIVMENKKSVPTKYSSGNQITHFTKSSDGRYGFFPVGK